MGFGAEGSPRQEGEYVEWIILVPARRKFDRVLIRATIHEVGLNDLDNLRRGVAQSKVDEGWLVTNLWVNQSVRQALVKPKPEDEGLTCLTFDELIDQDADFTPYFEWLKKEVEDKKIAALYVSLNCQKGEFDPITRTMRSSASNDAKDDIDFYIDRWLASPVTEHVSILGEFGTGKTWFTLHYAWKCLQDYQIAKAKGLPRPRLPLVIRLRDYAKSLDVKNVMAGFFFNQHNIKLNHAVFDRLNQMGKLLLIFDGFDEMANKVDRQKMVENFRELAQVVMPNSKVLLTCRTEHFDTAQDAIDNLNSEQMTDTSDPPTISPKFQTLELLKFDDEQIRQVLSRRTKKSATVERVMANEKLLDLLRRAVMAEYVLEALPDLEQSEKIDISRVYLYAVKRKMERDIVTGRTFTSLADKLYFLCELAWEMLSEDKLSLNYREFPDRLRVLFKDEVREKKHLDHWHYDMMGQTMLIRNDDGDYSPAHKSLLEFFVAYKLAAELGLLADDFLELARSQSGIDESLQPEFYTWSSYWKRGVDDKGERKLIAPLAGFKQEPSEKLRGTFGKKPLTKVILDLLLPALNLEVKYRKPNSLIDVIQSTQVTEVEYSGGNAATILVELEPNALEYQNLSGTNLAYANLVNAGLRGTDLSGSNLENCLTTRVFGTPNAVVVSKDDRQFITAHSDSKIRIWDQSGQEFQQLTGHQGGVNCLALIRDEKKLYSGSNDGTIKEWNLADGKCQHTFEGHKDWVSEIVLIRDEQRLYSCSKDGTIKEWNLADGKCQRTFESHKDWVRTIALSADEQRLYSGSSDRTIKEWNLFDGKCQHTFEGYRNSVRAIVLSGDGQRLYAGSSDRTIKEWNVETRECLHTFKHKNSVRAIALSADEKRLYSGSGDCMIKEWDVETRECLHTFKHENPVRAIALSGDEKRLYSGNDRTIKVWNLGDRKCLDTFEIHQNLVRSIALSKDGKLLYFGSKDGTIKVWNLTNGKCIDTFEIYQNSVNAIALSDDGQSLYFGSKDGTIKEWNLASGRCQRTFNEHQNLVNAIALSSDGQRLYSVSKGGTIKEWNLADGKCIDTFEIYQNSVNANAIALSGDGQTLYSGSSDRTIKEWNLADGRCQRTFNEHQNSVNAIALSGDGQRLYSGSSDRTIKEWDVLTGACLRTFNEHQHSVRVIALSGDGQRLYSGSSDRTIKEWDVATGKCLRSIDYRLCVGANITNVKGLTPAQTDSLLSLGAISDD